MGALSSEFNAFIFVTLLGPYTNPIPILLLCAPYKPTTIIVVPLH
jgi:hypothetical protein